MKIALLCGGPSLERGISLNSARSVLDHLGGGSNEMVPIYFDQRKHAFLVSPAQLYSNTPSDFDFKLSQTGRALNEVALIKILKGVDITFPVMHGAFGEDGGIQAFLEKHGIPFVGSGSVACKKVFDKHIANEYIKAHGFFTLPSIVLKIYGKDHRKQIHSFFSAHGITRAIVKPATGGSSIGVFSVSTPEEALEKVKFLFSRRMDTRVVVEPFARGVEFTTIILQNRFGLPVAILPTEIEADYSEHQFFDFRKKYLPTRQVTYHCPPRFSNEVIEKIQVQAEQLFALFGMHDFARFDGWVLEDGNIWFSDFNPVSGMEQNSFLFQQAARIGFTHRDALLFIVRRARERSGISAPEFNESSTQRRKPVRVLFGGSTSERQVSLMSGTNVWLKLRASNKYAPEPYLLDMGGSVWKLPYAYTLNHTVEEIMENCTVAEETRARLGYLEHKVALRLGALPGELSSAHELPTKLSFEEFLKNKDFVFIALHGGAGENGELQTRLSRAGINFNGSDATASHLCMDKWATASRITQMREPGVTSTLGKAFAFEEIKNANASVLWKALRKDLRAKTIIVKPQSDGCSSGVAHLYTSTDLEHYLDLVKKKTPQVPVGTFVNQRDVIEMPLEESPRLLFENFVETDSVRVKGKKLKHVRRTGLVEITAGIVEVNHHLHVFNPSLTVAEGEVLSVEEKFQGGTGVNLTPPPAEIAQAAAVVRAKLLLAKVAHVTGIRGYARIDAFMHRTTGDIVVIEINTLPGLTPATVFYHQALAEPVPLYPLALLELFIENKGY